jgi:hypothetical protein
MGTVTVDLQIQDNGTVKYTLSDFVDAKGKATTPKAPATASSSSPALVLNPDQSDTSGLALVWIGTPTDLATGVVATFTVDGVSENADPVDIVPGAVAGFKVSEAAQ